MTDHTFPSPPPGSASATVAAFTSIMKTGASDRNPTKELLNSIRILQRVLPVLFDIQGDTSAFEMELLWKGEEVDDVQAHEPASADSQFVIEDDDEDDEESEEEDSEEGSSRTPSGPPAPAAPPKKRLPSLGERLINAVIDLMYTCGFTLSPRVQVEHHKVQYIIWYVTPLTLTCLEH
jgi:High-temperature-induced dauer-formation protein